jgi:hypothetical protein
MNNIIEWIKVNKDIIDDVEIHICLESKEKSFDFRQFAFDFVIISMISLTIKAILAMSAGQNIINLY